MRKVVILGLLGLTVLAGCAALESAIFPVWDPNFFDSSPAQTGPFMVEEFVVDVADGADGAPTKVTVFRPLGAESPHPAFVWVLGSNVQPYYHQSLHETLASWGYAVIVPDARPLTFSDQQYHRRNTDLAKQAIDMAIAGDLNVDVDAAKVAVGGYSIGGTMAIFTAAEEPRVQAVVLWAPTSSPLWTGVDPEALYPQVTQPVYLLLAEKDHVEPIDGFPKDLQAALVNAETTEVVIPDGLHLYFQQPLGADSPSDPNSSLTRFEQQGIAIEQTRAWLNAALDVTPAE